MTGGVDDMDKGKLADRRLRHAVQLDATVTRDNGQAVQCTLSDLSLDGCCLSGFFKIGEHVRVYVPRIGVLSAEIRWAVMGRAGARFSTCASRAA